MQQTQTYKLNLLETSDAFSPSPLNENMEKVETKLAALDGADAAEAAARQALDQRVTALEAHKIYFGTYVGNGGDQFLELGYTPKAVILFYEAIGATPNIIVENRFLYYNQKEFDTIRIVPNGVQFTRRGAPTYNGNTEYCYLAFV